MDEITRVREPSSSELSPDVWQALADNIPQLAWVADPDGCIRWFNRRWYEYTGTTLEEVEKWGWQSVHHPDHVARVTRRYKDALRSGEAWEDIFPLRGADGKYRQFLSRANPIRDGSGRITHWAGTNTDITDQLATERALREASERVQLALEAGAIIGTWVWDLKADRFTVDEQFAENFGLDPALGRSGLSLEQVIESVHPDDKPGLQRAIAEAIARGGPYSHQYRVRRQDGHYYWIEASGRVETGEDGTAVRFPGVLLNVEDRRRVEEALRQSENEAREAAQELDAVYQSAPVGLTVLDRDLRYVRVNERLAEMNGMPAADHIGRTVAEIAPDFAEQAEQALRRVLDGEEMWGLELTGSTLAEPGVVKTWRENWLPVRAADGRITGVAIAAEDVTVEKAAERALARSEAQFRTTAEALPGMLFVTDHEGRNLYVNQFYKDYTGLSDEDLLELNWSQVIHPDDLPAVHQEAERARKEGTTFRLDHRLRRADGEYRWHATKAEPVLDGDGRVTRWIGVSIDTHDARVAEEERRQSEERLRTTSGRLDAILANTTMAVFLMDERQHCVFANAAAEKLTGYSFADMQGRPLHDVVHHKKPDGSHYPLEECPIDRAFPERAQMQGEELFVAPDGSFYPVAFTASPLLNEEGKPVGTVIEARNIAEEKAREAAGRESEERYRTVFQSAAVGIGRVAPDGSFLEINDRYCEILGRSREELIGGGWAQITHPDDLPKDRALVEQALRGEIDSFTLEKRYLARDGSEIWVNLSVSTERDDEGKVKFFIPVAVDIGERKKAEEALRRSELRYRALFESMDQGFCVIQVSFREDRPTDYRFLEINPAFTRQSGLEPSVLNRSVRETVPGLEEIWFERYGRIAATGKPERFVDRAEPLGRWFEVYAFRIGDPEDRQVAILFTDVTERVAQEEELKLRLNAIPQMVWSARPDGHHDFYNDRWYQFTGTPHGSTDGEKWNGMFHPEDQPVAWERWRHSLATGEPYEIEYRLRHHSGEYRWVLGRALPVRNDGGEIVRWMGTCTDIHDRVEARQALQESEARMRAVIEAAPIGLVFADPQGRITGGNARVEELMGHPVLPSPGMDHYGEWVGYDETGARIDPQTYPMVQVLRGADRAEMDAHWQRGDGTRSWLKLVAAPIRDANGELIGGVVASIDIDREKRLTESLEREVEKVIAEREAAQEALRQSQKLEAMGQLTGGVAHDFNNLLTPIIGSLDLLHRKELGDERVRRLVDGALQSAERAKTLVQRLLAFARRQPLQPTAVDAGRVVADMADLIASTSGPRIKVDVAIQEDLPPAHADSNQLEMALLNLAVNARDAMPDGGTLSISVRHDEQPPADLPDLKPRGHVVLRVADNGVGMDEETLARCIEPFYSTKGIGKGTGLGLSMVHGLAAQLGGALRIQSREGEGTTIELWLPVSGEEPSQGKRGRGEVAAEGEGTILLVDDEDLVRESTASMLGELGYRVVEAASAEEALALVKEGLRPDMLVSDHLMPGLSGTDLAVRLRRRMPGLPVLIVSGYAEGDSLAPAFPRLTKPFRQADLATSVRALRGDSGRAAPAADEE